VLDAVIANPAITIRELALRCGVSVGSAAAMKKIHCGTAQTVLAADFLGPARRVEHHP
jgi:hypothetical protein